MKEATLMTDSYNKNIIDIEILMLFVKYKNMSF